VRGESLGLAAEILGGDLGSAEYPLAFVIAVFQACCLLGI
jgi:hypothetical protein